MRSSLEVMGEIGLELRSWGRAVGGGGGEVAVI